MSRARFTDLLLLAPLVWLLHASCASDSSVAREADGALAGGAGGNTGGNVGTGAGWPGGSGGGGSGGSAQGGADGSAQGGSGGTSSGGATTEDASDACVPIGTGGTPCGTGGPCQFPQGVPDPDFIAAACTYQDTDPAVDAAVNQVMTSLSGCGIGSDCPITVVPGANVNEICQNWFAAVALELRKQGYCAGQHAAGFTDEIAVSNTCCEGKWYGYHICNYGGGKVVWNPGARRGWWMIKPSYCTP